MSAASQLSAICSLRVLRKRVRFSVNPTPSQTGAAAAAQAGFYLFVTV